MLTSHGVFPRETPSSIWYRIASLSAALLGSLTMVFYEWIFGLLICHIRAVWTKIIRVFTEINGFDQSLMWSVMLHLNLHWQSYWPIPVQHWLNWIQNPVRIWRMFKTFLDIYWLITTSFTISYIKVSFIPIRNERCWSWRLTKPVLASSHQIILAQPWRSDGGWVVYYAGSISFSLQFSYSIGVIKSVDVNRILPVHDFFQHFIWFPLIMTGHLVHISFTITLKSY